MKKLNQFCRDVYHPGVHLYFALNWVLAFYCGLCLTHGHALQFSPYLIVAILTLYLSLLFLRIMDEIKDYEYDLHFNPDRPLVKKSLTHRDLYFFILISCTGFLSLNALNGYEVLAILIGQIAYSFFLLILEKKSAIVRSHMMLNLILTYPINIALSIYITALFYFHWSTDPQYEDLILMLSFASSFLYYEFSRKIFYPRDEKTGKRSYSQALGFMPSLLLSDVFAFIAMGSMLYLTQSWIPVTLFCVQILRLSRVVKKEKITLIGSAYIGLFYACWILIALLDHFNLNFHLLIRP